MSRYLRVRMVLDRLVAAVGLVVLSPVIGVLGWLVHRHDGGPAFITVERVGRHGRSMRMWKLRSMRAESADGRATGVSLTSAGDDRITPIGAKLRAGHLDELPQLFNVVRGEMTLLGPRPEAPEYVDATDDDWRAVLAAPPGIAGPTQLAVGDWERDIITAAPDGSAYERDVVPVKVAIDRWYVEQASPGIDALVVVGLARRLAGRPVGALLERIRAGVPDAAGSLP
ncbi:MAG: sugar transferase [Gordonia sp. (in: high G+C Gram-positive bacteria)]|nr:MAG: sugar transferase [Gordonia sp. (in: high G+C Gram-positive bacteria)]